MAENVELEAALARSYNEFMATQCGQSEGRLWYIAVVPFRRPDLAAEEIRRVKKLGSAAGIYARGVEWDMPLSNPALWPIYEEAERQDLPIAVHTGNGASPTINQMLEGIPRPTSGGFPQINPWGAGLVSTPYVLYAFQQLLGSSLMDDFPKPASCVPGNGHRLGGSAGEGAPDTPGPEGRTSGWASESSCPAPWTTSFRIPSPSWATSSW